MQTEIRICFLNDYPSLMEGILQVCGCSKTKLKKYMSRKQLNISVRARDEIRISLNIINDGHVYPEYEGQEVKIISSHDEIIAISKPAKLHCHPLSYTENDNVLSALLQQNETSVIKVNPFQYDRGLLFRLDFETSGLLLLAKTQEMYTQVRENFHQITKSKTYLAAVHGNISDKLFLQHFLKPEGQGKKKIQICENSDMVANCSVEPIEYSEAHDITLVRVSLEQGHRHQIRVQLSAAGYPIIGDPIYGKKDTYQRLYLHCYEYQLSLDDKLEIFRDSNLDLFSDLFNFNS